MVWIYLVMNDKWIRVSSQKFPLHSFAFLFWFARTHKTLENLYRPWNSMWNSNYWHWTPDDILALCQGALQHFDFFMVMCHDLQFQAIQDRSTTAGIEEELRNKHIRESTWETINKGNHIIYIYSRNNSNFTEHGWKKDKTVSSG